MDLGGSGGDRTPGLVIANDALSQTELPTRITTNYLCQIYGKIWVVVPFPQFYLRYSARPVRTELYNK